MNVQEIKEKYLGDVSLQTPKSMKMDPSIVSAALKSLAGGKSKSIPQDFVKKVADNALEWAQKDKNFVSEWDKASFSEKKVLMVKAFKDYITKFKWAVAEGMKKYGVFDSVDAVNERYCIDIGVKVSGNEKGTKRLTMEKVFKSLDLPRAWKKVKKGDAVIIRTGMNGKDVDVAKIEYFNPNVVQIIARGGSTNLVELKNVGLMVPKIANEGYRSYKDSVDVEDKSSSWGKVVFGKSS